MYLPQMRTEAYNDFSLDRQGNAQKILPPLQSQQLIIDNLTNWMKGDL